METNERLFLDLSNEDLAAIYQNGDKEVIGLIYTRYKGLIYKVTIDFCKERHIESMYFEDFIDAATDCLFKALETFDTEKDTKFRNYWWTLVSRSFINEYRLIVRHRNVCIDPLSLDTRKYYLKDRVISAKKFGIEEIIDLTLKKYPRKFNELEKQFLGYLKEGFAMKEIVFFMGVNRSKVYRLRNTVISKIRKLNKIIKSN